MSRSTRRVGTLVLTVAAVAYLVWKIELGTTLDVLADTNLAWFALSFAIMVLTVPVLALRWGWLLDAHAIHERLQWLTRAYFVAYTAGQILPTALGGDAVRIVETARRHPGRTAVVTGTVVLERGLGGAATVLLGAVGFLLSIGEFDVSAYLWLEGVFVFGTILLGFLFFARSARPLLRRCSRCSSASGSPPRCARSTKASTTTAAVRGCSGGAGRHARRSGGPNPLDLGVPRGRSASISTSRLLRDGAAALPRDARAIHAEWARRARGVLRQLPRQPRRRVRRRPSRPASCTSS